VRVERDISDPGLSTSPGLAGVVPVAPPPRFYLNRSVLDHALIHGDPMSTALRMVRVLTPWLSLIDIASPREAFAASEAVCEPVLEDLLAHAERDPAAARGGGWEYLFLGVTSYLAVATYRVAHAVLNVFGRAPEVLVTARQMSEAARLATGVEIHPAADIGRKLVIDHGYGTVIGEQAIVGDNVVMLHGVTLGSRHAADGPVQGRRHPIVGDNVTFSYGSAVLGPIEIGSDARIGPGCTVTRNVPGGASVRLTDAGQRILLHGASAWRAFP
jgi:serine O-acetyltransferase